MEKQTQNEKILSWLKRGRRLTALKAFLQFKCLRLSGRINELRRKGFDIETRLVKTEGKKWIAEYKLNK